VVEVGVLGRGRCNRPQGVCKTLFTGLITDGGAFQIVAAAFLLARFVVRVCAWPLKLVARGTCLTYFVGDTGTNDAAPAAAVVRHCTVRELS